LQNAFAHRAHHRGQTALYSYIKSVTPPEPWRGSFIEFTQLCDERFKQIEERRANEFDVIAPWKKRIVGY
jgi:hypothetical protein